jgi:MFS family permease
LATVTSGSDPYRALRYRDFRWLLVATTLTFIASQMQSLVLGWRIYELTHEPLALGWMGLAEALPFLALTLPGGLVADRWDRRGLAIAATGLSLLGAISLLLWFRQPSNTQTWPLYAVQSLAGVSRAFSRPATQALGAELVPRAEYQNASTWRSTCFHFSMVVGPAVGGLLFAWGGSLLAFEVITILLSTGFLAMFIVRRGTSLRGMLTDQTRGLVAGVRFVFADRLILSALSLDLFAVLFGGAIALLPAFASDVLHVGPEGLGLMRTAPAVGAIVMSFVLAHRPPNKRAGGVLLAAVALFGVCWILFAFSHVLALSVGLLALSGAVDNVSVVLRATLVQTHTPPEMMGRVQAVNGFFIGSSNEIGAFESGLAAELLGLVPSVVFGGCMTLLVVAIVAYSVPELRRLARITD